MKNNTIKNDELLIFFQKYIKSYINHKKSINLSKATIYNITLVLERFYDYIANEIEEHKNLLLNDINKYFINNYLSYLTKLKISKNTQKTYLIIIKTFIIYIADQDIENYGFLKHNINKMAIKTEIKEKISFVQNEQKRLNDLIVLLNSRPTYLSQRNVLLIKLLMYTGMRISEIINLKYGDLTEHEDASHGLIYIILIKGKGNKERFGYISYSLINANLEFLRQKSKNEYIFMSTHGNRCNRSMLYLIVKNLLKQVGISKQGLHIFRHTFARNLVSKNINLSTIKDLLGHSNISVTAQFYAKSDENAKKNALFKNNNY